jgi:ABC-type glutathione transport system ATPase component
MASSNLHTADSHDLIRVQGARVNNLKDLSVKIPKRRLTVFTGVSGSGKSSLVFGTIRFLRSATIPECAAPCSSLSTGTTTCADIHMPRHRH